LGDDEQKFNRFSKLTKAVTCGRSTRLAAISITPHQFEKAKRIAQRTNLAELLGVDSGDWN
jgi:hypothetical protein